MLGGGGASAAILGTLGRFGLGRLVPQFLKRRIATDPRGILSYLRGDPITKRMTGKSGRGYTGGTRELITGVPSTTAGARALRAGQLLAAPAGLGITGAGLASAALPDISEKAQENVPLLNLLQGGRDYLLEPAADFNPLGAATYLLTGKTPTSLLQGPDKVTAGGSEGDVTPIIETQEEQFAALKEDAEKRAQLYMELMGEEPDTIGAISRGLIQAGQLYDEDKGAAVGALGMEADAETQRVKDIESQIKGMAVQDVIGADTARKQLVDQAKLAIVSSPDLTPDARSQALKGIEAYEQGIIDTLPLNAKQDAADLNKMRAGSVYFDPYNIYGGMYVAVSSNNQDPEQVKGFSDITEAQAHAAS